ncbi:hypothetical protein Tco_0923029 [Tanacetum coccineum]|uniref:Uncharacterized protein n=1 Tax=Tanacetum coccineum TaxID=301880 RepID=A0ABQ5CZT7_9ASTR
MCHRRGEIDQDAEQYQVKSPLLKAEFLKTNDMVEKEVYNELSNRFLQLEKHCISLEISMQQKEESFQSNKPCKNQDSPEFREFFEINELKAQLQAKNSTINNLKEQIKNVHEKSNEAKVKHDIDVIETINIELEHKVAKLLQENEHLKQTYKELYDSIKKTRIQTKDHNDSLIAQVNSKTVENADLKAQIQEKVFANVALKNELRKLKGNNMDTKFAKPSILGKPVLQPPRNQSVVRQPNAFKSERPNFSKPRFASQVDVNNVLSKPVTPHYLPKVREYVLAKPHHVIAPGSFRNSQEEPYGSNDMAHNHYLEEARKKTQERNRNSKPSVMHTTSLQNTTNGSKPNTRSNNQISRSLPVSKSSCGMSNGVSLVDHSRNSSSFSDSKHFVCSTCHKCVFNANHDNCITKFLKEVNSRAKVQSPKTRNNTKPVGPKSHTQKPSRQIAIGQRFSPKKSFAVHEKPNTPRSCLRWKLTGRIFKIAGLRWIPTGKMFTDYTTKVDSEPPNGSNDDITNPYECDQTLNVGAGTANLSAASLEDNLSIEVALGMEEGCQHGLYKAGGTKLQKRFHLPDPSHQTVTSTPPVIAPFTDVSSTKPSSLVTPPPINTEATTITTSLPEITPFIALQLRVARLEQEMSEVKKSDHSTNVLASIKSQVPTAVDKYLGTKLDDALLKVLERHTADLIEKYSVLPGPESIQNQESEKSPKEIIIIKKEQDEDAMDKEVADKVKNHKRKHDSDDDDEDDDDDEGPSAGSNQGKSAKRRRHDSGASRSAQPPTKDDEQSSKKPRVSDASASKQHPALTSTGWQITDTRDAGVDSSMHRSDPESEHSEQSVDNIRMQDEGHVLDLEDTDNAHIPKVSTTTWFKQIPKGERPATPELEWTIPPNDFPKPENNWANTYATTYQVPTENKLQRKTYDIGSFIKWFCRQTGKKKLYKADLEDVVSEHFDRDDNAGDDNEETKPDPKEIYK